MYQLCIHKCIWSPKYGISSPSYGAAWLNGRENSRIPIRPNLTLRKIKWKGLFFSVCVSQPTCGVRWKWNSYMAGMSHTIHAGISGGYVQGVDKRSVWHCLWLTKKKQHRSREGENSIQWAQGPLLLWKAWTYVTVLTSTNIQIENHWLDKIFKMMDETAVAPEVANFAR